MLDKHLAIVDIETTGMSALHNRIIEIAIIRVEQNKIVDSFSTLINPKTHISPFIIQFTGIHENDLKKAPVFEDVQERIMELLEGATFVAHNVRFDYTFIKSELRRIGIPFKSKTCCTVRLSRRLFPQHKSHSLESVIRRFDFSYTNRHRAYDDAHVLWQFLKKIKKMIPKEQLNDAWKSLTKSLYSVEPEIRMQVELLPEAPGIYLFYDKNRVLLYVGKSTNISSRVISHFSEDSLSTKHLFLMKETAYIDFIQTAGELGALLAESRYIKSGNPLYNRKLREKNTAFVLKKFKNTNGYLLLKSELASTHAQYDMDNCLRMFNSKTSMREWLHVFAQTYGLCGKLLGLEQGTGPCFGYKIGKCKGACIGQEKRSVYNARFLIAFIQNKQFSAWPFKGVIQITEKNDEEQLWERFTFNNWSLLKHEKSNGDVESYDESFDADTYSILSRYIKKGKCYNVKNI